MNDEIKVAVLFGRLLELAYGGRDLLEDEKASLGALEDIVGRRSFTMHVTDGQLYVEAIAIAGDTPFTSFIKTQLTAHKLSALVLTIGAPAMHLMRAVQALAVDSDAYLGDSSPADELVAAEVASVFFVSMRGASAVEEHRRLRLSEALEIVHGTEHEAAATPSTRGMAEARDGATYDDMVRHPPDASAGPTSLVARVEELRGLGAGPRLMAGLDRLQRGLEKAADEEQIPQIIDALLALIRLEQETESPDVQRALGVTVRRTLTTDLLRRTVPMLLDELYAADILTIMRRAGADGTRMIAQRLMDAPTFAERKAYLEALRQTEEGADVIASMLSHEEWFVVRNAADLVGELGLVEAVPLLGRVIEHEDARVRLSVAVALARIGTPETVRFLRAPLRDADRGIRLTVAKALHGKGVGALAMVLVSAADAEEDPGVRAEYYRALGRIGTPDAVQALIEAAQSGKGLLGGRKASPRRRAAVEGLGLAGGRAAVTALRELAKDRDRDVREAAQAALARASAE
jgi:HEAT repeat protein